MTGLPAEPDPIVAPLLAPGQSHASLTRRICAPALRAKASGPWLIFFALWMALSFLFALAVGYLLYEGVGIWGVNVPVAWGFAITNFVWWIGIGHAGTLISAILLLLRQEWRTSINRFAEAMTLFAVACAGLFPLLHLGRPWKFYFLLPYPNTLALWPQWRSPLVWDVFAVTTYMTVSFLFWYLGLIPDLASLRDRARRPLARVVYGAFALGWRGSARHWHRHQTLYLLLAGLATPLVVSVHSIVSLDFAVSLIPGWHSTIFPPYFVAGAIFSGFAMVITLAIPIRSLYRFHDLITITHLDNMAKVMLATGLLVAYGYAMEAFTAWYSSDPYESRLLATRALGPYVWAYWSLIAINIGVTQFLWLPGVRTNPLPLFAVALACNVGMWLERFVIVVTSLHRDFLPSSWGIYHPTVWDWATLLGSVGLFLVAFWLFMRLLPAISIYEVRELLWKSRDRATP